MSGRLKALASDSVVYGLSGVVSRFLTIWLVPIYTRVFTPADYGVLALVTVTMQVVAILSGLALDNSAHRWFWDTEDELERKATIASWAWCGIAVAIAFALTIEVFAEPLARLIIGSPPGDQAGIVAPLRVAALTLPVGVLQFVLNGWLRMRRRPVVAVAFATTSSVLQIGLTLVFVLGLRWGVTGVFIAQLATMAMMSGAAGWILGDWIHPRHFRGERLRAMVRYALPLVPGGLAFWTVSSADRYFLRAFASTSDVGLYSIGGSIAMVVALLTGAFQQAWSPFAMSIHKQPDARQTYASVFLLYAFVAGGIAAAVALFAREGLLILATPRYLDAARVVGPLAFSTVMIGLTYVAAIGPALARVTRSTATAFACAALVHVVLNLVLTPRFGMVGSAMATLVAQTVTPVYLFRQSQKLYPIPYRFGAGAAILGMGLGLAFVAPYLVFRTLTVTILVKLAILSLFGAAAIAMGLVPPVVAHRLRAILRPG